jgi:hypothetical protein
VKVTVPVGKIDAPPTTVAVKVIVALTLTFDIGETVTVVVVVAGLTVCCTLLLLSL